MKISDIFTGVFLMLVGLWVGWEASHFPIMRGQSVGPSTFPFIIATGFFVCGAIIAVKGWREAGLSNLLVLDVGWREPGRLAGALLALGGAYLIAFFFEEIGFPLGVGILLAALYFFLGYRSPLWLGVSAVFAGGVYYVMAKVPVVPLPLGPLG